MSDAGGTGAGRGGRDERPRAGEDPASSPRPERQDRPPDLRALLRLLWDHAGRIAAIFLGIVAALGLLFLAIIGSTPALVLLVVLVVGVAMIALGGRIRA